MITLIIINGFVLFLTYFLIASGLTIVFSIMGIVNFAHGAIIMLGGMFAYFLFTALGINFYLSLVLATVGTAAFSLLLKRLVFDYFKGWLPLAGMIAALGASMIIEQGTLVAVGGLDKVFPKALPQGVVNLLGTTIGADRLTVVLISLAVMCGLFYFLHRTKLGMTMRAAAQEPVASQLCGVSIDQVSIMSMALAGALAGIAGALLGALFTVSPYWGESLILKAFFVIILGGLGSVPGAIVGSAILGFVESTGVTLAGYITHVLVFVILVILLLVRPKGILGHD